MTDDFDYAHLIEHLRDAHLPKDADAIERLLARATAAEAKLEAIYSAPAVGYHFLMGYYIIRPKREGK